MASKCAGSLKLALAIQEYLDAVGMQGVGSRVHSSDFPQTDFLNGYGIGQIDRIWSKRCTCAAANTDNFILSPLSYEGTAQYDLDNVAIAFAKVKLVYIFHRTAGASSYLALGPAAANGWCGAAQPFTLAADELKIWPEGLFLLYRKDGYTVTAGANPNAFDILNNAAASVDYDILIAGTTT